MLEKMKIFCKKSKFGELNWKIDNKEEYISFSSSQQAAEWGEKYYEDWGEKYKTIMKEAKRSTSFWLATSSIECYCGESYRDINNFLRNDKDCESNLYRELSDILAIVICSAPKIPDNIIVYRMVCKEFIEKLINNNKKGEPAEEQGYLSASLLKEIVNGEDYYTQNEDMLKIYVNKESIATYVNAITDRSEEEILFLPNRQLGLIEYPYEDKSTGKTIYECKFI